MSDLDSHGLHGDRSGGRTARVLSLLFCVSFAVILILIQPATPWWLTLDCDGSYLGSAANLYAGRPTLYFDHPGMPLQILLTFTIAADHAVQSLYHPISRTIYVENLLANMGEYLWMIRGWAAIFFILGIITVHEVSRRIFGHWEWGVLATLLYAACIGHLGRAIMYRPDLPLASLSILVVYLITEAVHRRCVVRLIGAAFLTGLTITTKVHAVGLLPALLLGVGFLYSENWTSRLKDAAVRFWTAKRRLVLLSIVFYGVVVIVTNRWRPSLGWDHRATVVLFAIVFSIPGVAWFTRVAPQHPVIRFVVHPMWPVVWLAVLAGMVLPNAFLMDQIVMMLRFISYALTGRGVNSGFDPAQAIAAIWNQWKNPGLLFQLPLVLLAAVGAFRCFRARRYVYLIWGVAGATMFALAGMRAAVHGSVHHYGSAVALLIPLMLMAFSQVLRRPTERHAEQSKRDSFAFVGPKAVASLVVVVVAATPTVTALQAAWYNYARCQLLADITARYTPRLGDSEFIMTDYWAQNEDSGYFMQVRDWCEYTPEKNYRSLPDTPPALRYACGADLTPAYYITSGEVRTKLTPLDGNNFVATSVWGDEWLVERLEIHELSNIDISVFRVKGLRTSERESLASTFTVP